MYLELVNKYKSQHKFKLFSYNLLPDRLELLIETGDDASISEIMHDLNSLYTKYFNGRHQKRGHLFESRFKSVLVEKANYLLSMTRHIHLKSIDNPYSSFHVYIQSQETAVPVDSATLNIHEETKEVLDFLKNKDDVKAYERYVLEGDKNEIEELEKSLKRGQALGSESFQREVKNKVRQHVDQLKEEGVTSKTNPRVILMAGALVLLVSASAVYLYVSKHSIENKYQTLLKQKEQEFKEKTKFENRSPLAPTELEGSEWEIETVPSPHGGVIHKDHILFKNGRFESRLLAAKDFRSSNYFLVPQGGGVTLWQSAQSNPAGELASWRGTWQGDAMKGSLVVKSRTGEESYSFFSLKWSYTKESTWTENAGEAK